MNYSDVLLHIKWFCMQILCGQTNCSNFFFQIRSVNSDIIALQEICQDVDGTRNQILDIKEILPSFKWVLFRDANSVTRVEGTILKGWSREGNGIS